MLLGPFPIAFDTPDIIDPGDYGPELGPVIPAGRYIYPFAIVDVEFAQPGNLRLGFGSSAEAQYLDPGLDLVLGPDAGPWASISHPVTGNTGALNGINRYILTEQPGHLVAAIYPTSTPPTQGTARVYAVVISP